MKKVLDGNGFVELLETMGNDLTVVNAARVSFEKESHEMSQADERLLHYLAKHNHNSPFFHPQIRLRIQMPLFVAREYFRHTVGLSRNEVSRRYIDIPPICWIPSSQEIRERHSSLKQGSKSTPVPNSDEAWELINTQVESSLQTYKVLLEKGVAPEIARTILPQSMYTTFIETGSLSAYARICQLRLDPSAQKEIQEYAKAIDIIMKESFPVSWNALFS